MTRPQSRPATRHALLIGIDFYFPNQLTAGSYGHLFGCVRDVSHIEGFLKSRLGLSEDRIIKLTASHASGTAPAEPPEQLPTYENMVAAFQRLTEQAQPGDHLYIHYSGHGGRARTILPELKGETGIDEVLVPTDIGDSEARYLRDSELAHLLQTMVERDLVVTVVLDSCHSGGMTRGEVAVRGSDFIDSTERPTGSLVAPRDTLAARWRALTDGATRNVTVGSGWLPEPTGYTLLAACRSTELAHEAVFDTQSGERNGALTYWLLDSLRDIGPGLSYKVLHDRILGKVHARFEQQTPILQGEGTRVVFGTEQVPPHFAVPVLNVEPARVRLDAGQVHGLRRGAQFAIYPHSTTDFADRSRQLAVVEIREAAALGGTDSWAAIVERMGTRPIEEGDQALLLGTGNIRLVQRVALVESAAHPAAQEALRRALAESAWVTMIDDDGGADYQLSVNADGTYEIGDMAGVPIRNLRPALHIDDEGAAAQVVQRLEHLARYHAVAQLNNADQRSPLAHKVTIELLGRASDYDPADPFEPEETFEAAGAMPAIAVGEWTALRIHNGAAVALNIALLDLQPDWGITQLYPQGVENFVTLDPGEERVIALQGSLPAGYMEGVDTLKLFATKGTTSFRWLTLPPLDQPIETAITRGEAADDELEQLFAAITAQAPTRNLRPATAPTFEWVTEQVQLRIEGDGHEPAPPITRGGW